MDNNNANIFESDKTLSFENANEQGASYKASVRENHKNKPGSKLFTKDNNWDSDDEDFEHVSRKSKKRDVFIPTTTPRKTDKMWRFISCQTVTITQICHPQTK